MSTIGARTVSHPVTPDGFPSTVLLMTVIAPPYAMIPLRAFPCRSAFVIVSEQNEHSIPVLLLFLAVIESKTYDFLLPALLSLTRSPVSQFSNVVRCTVTFAGAAKLTPFTAFRMMAFVMLTIAVETFVQLEELALHSLAPMPYQAILVPPSSPCSETGAAAVPFTLKVPATLIHTAPCESENRTTVPASMRSSVPAGTVRWPWTPWTM